MSHPRRRAKKVDLGESATYFNTGTRADLIEFPKEVLSSPPEDALAGVRGFVEDMKNGRYESWIKFDHEYVEFVIEGDRVVSADLLPYKG